ncbi:MAG: BatD family protein [Prevotella sp.]|nr:BatD family protein [Candidatus Prevotella equi]
MKKIVYIYIYLLFVPMVLLAQKITVQGPTQVSAGEQFYLRYTVNTTDVKGFRAGNIPDAFEVLMGPSQSTQQSISIVNGNVTQNSSVTYTYVLMATKNGTFVIPSARATVAGNNVNSQALKITVSGSMPQNQGGGRAQQQRPQQRVERAGSRISGNDLFIKVTANKQRVHEQEPILLTYKVYTQVELTQLEGKMPDLNGFHTQEVPLPQQKSFHIESINGRSYNCVTWSQYVMYPQMSGKLEIPALTFKGIVVQQNPNVDPFEAFFNGGSGYIEVKKEIVAPSVTIQVDPLPDKPANFSGGVGTFDVSASIEKNTVKAGDPVSLRFVVNGTGNMKLIKAPEVTLPKDFDKYEPKITDKTKLTANGITGSMIYDMLIVPRNMGKYTIPAMEFVYFDTKSSSYKTLTTQPIELTVEKGSGKGGGVVDYSRPNDNDVSDIITDKEDVENPSDTLFGSNIYIGVNAIVVLLFIALLVIFRKRAMDLADVAAMRGKNANKVAGKRLKIAAKLLKQGKGNEFYDEVLRALWGYVSDKLTMPVEQLSRENISQKLSEKNVTEEVVNSFIEAIDECEFARFAPGDPVGNMNKTYDKAADAITNIENGIKKPMQQNSTIVRSVILLMMILPCSAICHAGNDKANADAAYRNGDYQNAIALYQKELKSGVSASAYHNLGNAYYRIDNIPMAILSYEKAKKLSPMDKRIQHSLDIARNKTIDKLQSESDFIFVQWFQGLCNSRSIDSWAKTALVSLVVSLLLFLVYLFIDNMVVRRVSFYGSCFFLVIFIATNVFAWNRKRMLDNHDSAVVMSPVVVVKSSPTIKSPDACVIHEGTCVSIKDKEMKGWYGIRLSDGREGWIKANDVKEI